MKLFPAIDIMGGKCVRLLHGDKEKATVYGDALEMAKKWENLGAKYLHLVDLDGAFTGKNQNLDIIKEIVRSISIPVQLGGGIRTMQDIDDRLNSTGVSRVILGTVATTNSEIVKSATDKYGDRIACGIDCKNGFVSIKGWTEETELKAVDFALKLKGLGVSTVIYTDISRDGALTGVNYNSTIDLQKKSGLNVIASGGVSSIQDLKILSDLGVYGAILGKALYAERIDLREAICLENE